MTWVRRGLTALLAGLLGVILGASYAWSATYVTPSAGWSLTTTMTEPPTASIDTTVGHPAFTGTAYRVWWCGPSTLTALSDLTVGGTGTLTSNPASASTIGPSSRSCSSGVLHGFAVQVGSAPTTDPAGWVVGQRSSAWLALLAPPPSPTPSPEPSPEPSPTSVPLTGTVQLEGLEPVHLQFAVGLVVFVLGLGTVGVFTGMQRGG